jgi:hypothetical protein
MRQLRPLQYEGDSPKGFGWWTNGASRVELTDNGHHGAQVLIEGSAVASARRGLYDGARLRKGITLRHRGEELVITGRGSTWRNSDATVDWRDRTWLIKHTAGSGVVLERGMIAVTGVARNRPLSSDAATVDDLVVLFVVGYADIGITLSLTALLANASIPWYPYHRFPRV